MHPIYIYISNRFFEMYNTCKHTSTRAPAFNYWDESTYRPGRQVSPPVHGPLGFRKHSKNLLSYHMHPYRAVGISQGGQVDSSSNVLLRASNWETLILTLWSCLGSSDFSHWHPMLQVGEIAQKTRGVGYGLFKIVFLRQYTTTQILCWREAPIFAKAQ